MKANTEFEYAVIRFCPSATLGQQVNIAVIAVAPATGMGYLTVRQDLSVIRGLFGAKAQLNVARFLTSLASFVEGWNDERRAKGSITLSNSLEGIKDRGTAFQFSPVRSAKLPDFEAQFEEFAKEHIPEPDSGNRDIGKILDDEIHTQAQLWLEIARPSAEAAFSRGIREVILSRFTRERLLNLVEDDSLFEETRAQVAFFAVLAGFSASKKAVDHALQIARWDSQLVSDQSEQRWVPLQKLFIENFPKNAQVIVEQAGVDLNQNVPWVKDTTAYVK